LGNASDNTGASYCLDLLEKHPEETKSVLQYLTKQKDSSIFYDHLISFLQSENSIYDYQGHLIVGWLLKQGCDFEDFKSYLRAISFDNNKPSYYKAIAKQALGSIGDYTDLNRIKDSLAQAPNLQEQRALICSTTRLESSVRNSFFSKVCDSNPPLLSACEYARNTKST